MNRPPAFQFYPKDWLDFRVQRMSLAAQGAYLKILCFMWKDSQDQCSIIADDRAIATAIGVPCEKWKELRAEIQFPGDPILKEEGKERPILRSCRLQREAEKQQNYATQQAEKGKRGAQKRWQKEDSHSHSSGHAPAIAQGMTENSSSSSSSLNKDTKREHGSFPANPQALPKANTKKKPVLVPMPAEFAISDTVRTWAAKQGIQRDLVEREFETFCNDRLSKGVQYADWDRAFMTWLSRHGEFVQPRRNGHVNKKLLHRVAL